MTEDVADEDIKRQYRKLAMLVHPDKVMQLLLLQLFLFNDNLSVKKLPCNDNGTVFEIVKL